MTLNDTHQGTGDVAGLRNIDIGTEITRRLSDGGGHVGLRILSAREPGSGCDAVMKPLTRPCPEGMKGLGMF